MTVRLRPSAADRVAEDLAAALAGGPPILPLPTSAAERTAIERLVAAQASLGDDAAAVVATSGSTGQPKGVVLSRHAISAAVGATHDRLGGPGDWLLALPEHYVAGLMVAARAIVGGTALLRCGTDLVGLPAALDQVSGRAYLSLVPTQLHRALAEPATTAALARLDAVLLGGAAAEEELLVAARAAGIRVVETYGMSETCGGCVYDGMPLGGVGVRLAADQRIVLSGPMLFDGYYGCPDLTAELLTGGEFRTADRGRIAAGRLTVLGRIDDVVVSGGVNVDLAEVERAVRGVASDSAVVAVPDAEWGALVVAVTEQDTTLDELRAGLVAALAAAALPRRLLRVAALPRTAGGKIDRQRLRLLIAQADESEAR